MSMTESEVIRMTENEAVEMFRKLLDVPCEMIVKYDSVLTKDKYRELVKIRCAEEMAIAALEEIQQYRAIGTVSEFRELKEKATVQKSILYPFPKCPICKCSLAHALVNYCHACGQKLGLSEGKE